MEPSSMNNEARDCILTAMITAVIYVKNKYYNKKKKREVIASYCVKLLHLRSTELWYTLVVFQIHLAVKLNP